MSRIALVIFLGLLGSAFSAEPSTDNITRIGFGSCAKQDQPQPIWDAILSAQPDVSLMLGDNIYGDSDDMQVLRDKWQKLAAQRGFQKLRQSAKFLATWDDHDYGRDDAGNDYPFRQESQQVFLDFLDEPADSPRRAQEGVYAAEIVGEPGRRIQLILLDTRYHRSPLKKNGLKRVAGKPYPGPYEASEEADATMLGEAQWEWLKQQLQAEAEVRLICSSIQVLADEHHWEKWGNFPRERQRLLELIRNTKAKGVILLSGDRHHAEITRVDDAVGYSLFDVTSSSLNSPSQPKSEPNVNRLGELFTPVNFGWIEIDWNDADPTVTLAIRNIKGRAVNSYRCPLSALEGK